MDFRIESISKTYGAKTLFKDISLLVHEHDRIGLIGINGTGKSSLLNIMSKKDTSDSGEIISSNSYTVGHLEQDTVFPASMTLSEVVFSSPTPQLNAVKNYELIMNKIEEQGMTETLQIEYDKAESEMIKEVAWNTEVDVKTILTKLGLPDVTKTIDELSGGQQKRVGLAQILIQSPDLLLLDEPTNHLDYDAIQWLETYLSHYKGAVIVVTHDRYFLDKVATRIVELSNSHLIEYKGNYASYVEQKAERVENEQAQDAKKRQLYKQELSWMRAGVQARGTKQQARIQRFESLKSSLESSKQTDEIEISMATQRLGKKVILLENATLSLNNKLLIDDLNLLVQARDRVGIAGKNGVGKSTLLNVLSGRQSLDSGIYEVGETVKLAYYTQQNENMDTGLRVIQYLQEVAEEVQLDDGVTVSVTEMLERFLFPRSMHGVQISSLSGGERRRLFLLRLLISQPNVLLLDEPTNDLDIDTLTILENYIQSFPGAVIAVSHDRYFLDKTMDKLLIFLGNGKITMYYGTMSDYLDEISQNERREKKPKTSIEPQKIHPEKKKKLSYQEKQEWDTIEQDISNLEDKMDVLSTEMERCSSNFTLLQEKQIELNETEQLLNDKMERWEYLSELADT